MNRTILALSVLVAASFAGCASTPEQLAAFHARQARAQEHGHCQVVVCVDSVSMNDTPALYGAPINNQAPAAIANRSH